MSQVGSLIWLVIGASLVGVVTRAPIPPLAWLALTFVLHASRSMPAATGTADFFATGDRTMTAQVPVGGVATLYARVGDLFAWLCVAGLMVPLGMAAVRAAKL